MDKPDASGPWLRRPHCSVAMSCMLSGARQTAPSSRDHSQLVSGVPRARPLETVLITLVVQHGLANLPGNSVAF